MSASPGSGNYVNANSRPDVPISENISLDLSLLTLRKSLKISEKYFILNPQLRLSVSSDCCYRNFENRAKRGLW